MLRALVLDDDPDSLELLTQRATKAGFDCERVTNLRDARLSLETETFDVALMDVNLPDGSSLDLLPELEASPTTHIVFLTGRGSVEGAVQAFRGGAVDYLTKPADLARLALVLRNAAQNASVRRELASLREELQKLGKFGQLIGACEGMQALYARLDKVAPTDTTVFIQGETGCGKEVVARAIHERSRRASETFVAINCGAVAPSLIESELYGHEKGSFTGADRRRLGIFERAHHGTLFLDEITEMPPELQVKLLRTLETGEVTRLGSEQTVHVDVRVIAATNRDPLEAVREGLFRQDLFYRLNVFTIEVPPLRERGSRDIALLATEFIDRLNSDADENKTLSAEALDALAAHTWPGNVRELLHAIESAFIMAGTLIEPQHFGLDATETGDPTHPGLAIDVGMTLAQAERRLVLATLEHTKGNKRRAAEMLKLSPKTLYARLARYNTSQTE